jgi:hypothetical protein
MDQILEMQTDQVCNISLILNDQYLFPHSRALTFCRIGYQDRGKH